MNATIRKPFLFVSLLLVSLGSVTVANVADLQEKLKRQVKLELNDVTIAAALQQIGDKGGFAIELSDEAVWELPDGAETRLSVTLEGQLDQSLEEMLNAFFMRYAVGSDAVVVYPRPELRHIMGRPTAQTLELLRNIYTNAVDHGRIASVQESQANALAWIRTMVGQDLVISPPAMAAKVPEVMYQVVRGSRGTPMSLAPILDEVVESVSRDHDQWMVCEPEWPNQMMQIKIIPHSEYYNLVGHRVMDMSFENVSGVTILKNLAAVADIRLGFEDNDQVYFERKISIEALNITVDEALDRVTAALGGEVANTGTDSDGTLYRTLRKRSAPTPTTASTEPMSPPSESAGASGDYVGKISIPMDGGRYFLEFMLRESDLTDELRRLRAARIQQILKTASNSNTPETAPVR